MSPIFGDFDVIENHIMHGGFGKRLGDDENWHSGGMIRPLDKGQPGDDLGCPWIGEAAPPRAFRCKRLARRQGRRRILPQLR